MNGSASVATNGALSREAILAYGELPRELVHVAALGGSVWVRTLTAGQRDRYEMDQFEANKREKAQDYRARLVAATACDADGRLLFAPGDIPLLSDLSCAALDPIYEVALRLNRFTSSDVKELEKN